MATTETRRRKLVAVSGKPPALRIEYGSAGKRAACRTRVLTFYVTVVRPQLCDMDGM